MELANLSVYYTWKALNLHITTINLKFMLQLGMINLVWLMDHILFSDIQDFFGYIIKKHETVADNPPEQMYVNKIKNRIVFKIMTNYKLEFKK